MEKRCALDHGKQVEWLSFEGEGHGLYKYQSQQAYFKALLAFLDANIGSRALAARGRAEAVPPATAQQSTVTP